MNAEDIKSFRNKMKEIKSTLRKNGKKCILLKEISGKNALRSIYTCSYFKKTEILTLKNIVCKRPRESISPERFNEIIDKKLN